MTLSHSHAGPAVAAAALVVAVIVGVVHPVAGAMEVDDGTGDEQQADTDGDVDAEQTESTDGEATTDEATTDGEATDGEAEADADDPPTEESAPEAEPTAEPEPDADSGDAAGSDGESAPEPDGESAPEPDSESAPDSGSEPERDAALEPEPNPEPDAEPEPEPEPEPTPKVDSDAGEDAAADAQGEVDDAGDRVAGPVPEGPDSDADSGSDGDPEAESSSDASPSDTSAAAASSSPSGSAGSSHAHADDSASRAQPMAPRSSGERADDERADDAGELAVVPGEGVWPKRTLEAAAGEAVRPIAREALSGADLAALKSTDPAYPAGGAPGVRAPLVAGPGDRTAEPVPAPQTAADGGMVERVTEVLGGAVSGGGPAGISSAMTVPMWLMLTALALLLVVVAGHLRWAAVTGAPVSAAGHPRRRSGGTRR